MTNRSNTWEEEDFSRVLTDIEELDTQAESIMAEARGRVGGLRKKQGGLKKEANNELGIPRDVLNSTLKARKLERKLEEVAKSVNDDDAELYEEAMGQFSFLKPEKGQENMTSAQIAANRAKTAASIRDAEEQKEGAAILEDALKEVH